MITSSEIERKQNRTTVGMALLCPFSRDNRAGRGDPRATQHRGRATRSMCSSPRGTENAKIRDGVLDIKRLRQIDANGLELWEPVFKARFPLSRSDLRRLCGLGAAARNPASRNLHDRAIHRRGDHCGRTFTLRVHKSRRTFTFAGCIAELVRLAVECECSRASRSSTKTRRASSRRCSRLGSMVMPIPTIRSVSGALSVSSADAEQQKGSRHG